MLVLVKDAFLIMIMIINAKLIMTFVLILEMELIRLNAKLIFLLTLQKNVNGIQLIIFAKMWIKNALIILL